MLEAESGSALPYVGNDGLMVILAVLHSKHKMFLPGHLI